MSYGESAKQRETKTGVFPHLLTKLRHPKHYPLVMLEPIGGNQGSSASNHTRQSVTDPDKLRIVLLEAGWVGAEYFTSCPALSFLCSFLRCAIRFRDELQPTELQRVAESLLRWHSKRMPSRDARCARSGGDCKAREDAEEEKVGE